MQEWKEREDKVGMDRKGDIKDKETLDQPGGAYVNPRSLVRRGATSAREHAGSTFVLR